MLNGDNLWNDIHDLTGIYSLLGFLYSITFIFFAISVIQNVILIAVKDGYLDAKYRSKYDWVESLDKGA